MTLDNPGESEVAVFASAESVTPATAKRIPAWVMFTGLMLFLGHLPLLASYGMGLMAREPYQFAPLAAAAAIFLVWHRLRLPAKAVTPGIPSVTLALLAIAFGVLCVATFKWSPWLAVISALLTALAAVWALGGFSLVKILFPAALMLLVLVRPPLGLDTQFTQALRGLAVYLSSCLLDQLDVPHFLSGNVVESVNQRFLVEEACSGINSVLFVGAFSLFYTLWRRRPWWHVLMALLAAISFVLLGNVFRITVGVMLSYHYDIDVLSGWPHQAFGLVLIVGYLGLAASADALLALVAPSSRAARGHRNEPATGAGGQFRGVMRKLITAMTQSWGPLSPHLALVIGVAFLLVAFAQTGWAFVRQSHKPAPVVSSLRKDAEFTVPERIGEWTRIDRKERNVSYLELEAIYSRVWAYQNGRMVVFVALDYPYSGLHDLTVCYFNQGWKVNVGAHPVKASDAAGKPQDYFEVEMRRRPMTFGHLLYAGFTEDGQWAGGDFNRLLRRRFSDRLPVTYQVQVLSATYTSLTLGERQQMLQLFLEARELLSKQVLAQLKGKS